VEFPKSDVIDAVLVLIFKDGDTIRNLRPVRSLARAAGRIVNLVRA
jgi:hypothetical protein